MTKERKTRAEEQEQTGRKLILQWHDLIGYTLDEFLDTVYAKCKMLGIPDVCPLIEEKLDKAEAKDRGPIKGITVAIRGDQVGISMCSANDQFQRKIGHEIAVGRLNLHPYTMLNVIATPKGNTGCTDTYYDSSCAARGTKSYDIGYCGLVKPEKKHWTTRLTEIVKDLIGQ
jgi:hypothetical protein